MQPPGDNLRRDRDACGIGFLADASGGASREIVDGLLEGLARMRHRGAVAADRRTGDGAGLLLPLPRALIPAPWCGLAMVFLRDSSARAAVEEACLAEGLGLGGWREVPTVPQALGEQARATMPRIEQLVVLQPYGVSLDEAEARAYRARKRAEATDGAYIASLSFRTVTYKALCAADQLAAFYPDLRDPDLTVPFGIFHQRFSTNTAPSWERAQPFRLLCHNGEINSIDGNVAWMRARGHELEQDGSDSTLLDNALELLVRDGRDIRQAAAMLIPEAVDADPELDPDVRTFYRYHSTLLEPWDGPAGVVFTDGRVVGATLDRNGLRPLRYAVADERLVACASEAGALPLPEGARIRRGRLGPGQMIVVDPAVGVEENQAVKQRVARKRPYARWLRASVRPLDAGAPVEPPTESLTARQAAAGLHARGSLPPPPPVGGHRPRADLVHGRRHCAPAAGRPCTSRDLVPAPTFCAGDESADRPFARAFRHVAAHVARRPGAAGRRASARGSAARARELLPLPVDSRRARTARRSCSTPPSTSRRDYGAPACGLASRQRRARRGCSSSTTARAGWPIPAVLAVGAVHQRLVAAGAPHGEVARRRERRARGRRTTSRACSATAPTRSAHGLRSRPSRHWRPTTSSAATIPHRRRRSCASASRSRTAC